jgi:hypothetical protein
VKRIEKEFERLSKRKSDERSLPLPSFAVSTSFFDDKSDTRRLRGRWCRIERVDNPSRHIYRTFSFDPSLKGTGGDADNPSQIVLDWDGWTELLEDEEKSGLCLHLGVTIADWTELFDCLWRHPDPTSRASFKIALVSLLCGVLALLISLQGLPP